MKKLFVLGAGFSISANAPSQERIIQKIFETAKDNEASYIANTVSKFKHFLSETLCIPENLHHKVPLEDVFTPLDRCLADNLSFRNLSVQEIREIRELIYYLIGKTLQILLANSSKVYIDKFANFLVDQCRARQQGNYKAVDPITVISTNWDILLDNSIKNIIDTTYEGQAVVDYCCHISSYWPGDESVKPGLEMLGRGGFNVKLIKLHGSLNWLNCPRCNRLYVDFYNKIAINQFVEKQSCRHCDNHFGQQPSHILVSNLIMPTFLKDLGNPQYKLLWQNAGIELAEADEIIFIGYSLPQADFEMRQLLSRMVKDNAKISVVDFGSEDDFNVTQMMERYRVFFGSRALSFYLKGAERYMFDKEFINH